MSLTIVTHDALHAVHVGDFGRIATEYLGPGSELVGEVCSLSFHLLRVAAQIVYRLMERHII